VIGEDHVLTNRHVVEDGIRFKVRFETDDQTGAHIADLVRVAGKKDADLALLHCENLPVKGLPLRESLPTLGSELRVLGFPLGDMLGANLKVSRGVVSALPPHRGLFDPSLQNLLMHDAATLPGSSGGPICDQHGSVIGVHTAALAGGGQYKFAVSSRDAISFLSPHVPGVFTVGASNHDAQPWEAAVDNVKASTVQVIVQADADRFDPVDANLGEITWDAYDDPWCMVCYGRSFVDCSDRGCANGGVRGYRTRVFPNPTGLGGRIERIPIRVKCETCDGQGTVSCPYCEYGFDPKFENATNEAWWKQYVERLSRAGAPE
jgi:hypothetical protein